MAEQFTNKATTTLNGAINNSTTNIVVTSATGFPTSGDFRIVIKAEGGNTDEILTVTAVSGTTWTVTRASEAIAGVQSASAHSSGATVSHVLTAGALRNFALPTGFIGARAYETGGVALTTGVTAVIPLGGENFDTDGFHSVSSNTSRMTIPAGLGGYYLIIGQGAAAVGSGSTAASFNVAIYQNGASIALGSRISVVSYMHGQASIIVNAVPGDYFEVAISVDQSGLTTYDSALQIMKLDSSRVGSGIGAKATRTTDQTGVANTTDTRISYTGTDIFDTDGFHDSSTNPSRMTIPTGLGGKYLVTATVIWDTNTSGTRHAGFWVNGGGYAGDFVRFPASSYASAVITDVLDLNAGDYVEVNVYQDSGGSRTLSAASLIGQMTFTIMRLDSQAPFHPIPVQVRNVGGNLSTTSTSYVAISSSLDVTATIGASGVAEVTGCLILNDSSLDDCFIGVGVDAGGATDAGCFVAAGSADYFATPFNLLVTGLTPGSHTFKLYWRTALGTTLKYGNSRGGVATGSWVQVKPY